MIKLYANLDLNVVEFQEKGNEKVFFEFMLCKSKGLVYIGKYLKYKFQKDLIEVEDSKTKAKLLKACSKELTFKANEFYKQATDQYDRRMKEIGQLQEMAKYLEDKNGD